MIYFRLTLSVILLTITSYVSGHMEMVQPPPRMSQFNPTYKGYPDFDMNSPLDPSRWPFPCRGYHKGGVVQTIKAGNTFPVKIGGGAPHNGGHCQFAISYDDKTFVVLKDVFDDCLIGSLVFNVTIPSGAPSGRATLAWTWINKTGNREYYMNCADIEILGKPNGYVSGPKLLVVNLPGYVTIPEFTFGEYSGKDLFPKRPIVKIIANNNSTSEPSSDSESESFSDSEVESEQETEPTKPIKPMKTNPPVKPSKIDEPVKATKSNTPHINNVTTDNKLVRCSGYEVKCVNSGQSSEFKVCTNGYEYNRRCAPGTLCYGEVNQMYCSY